MYQIEPVFKIVSVLLNQVVVLTKTGYACHQEQEKVNNLTSKELTIKKKMIGWDETIIEGRQQYGVILIFEPEGNYKTVLCWATSSEEKITLDSNRLNRLVKISFGDYFKK